MDLDLKHWEMETVTLILVHRCFTAFIDKLVKIKGLQCVDQGLRINTFLWHCWLSWHWITELNHWTVYLLSTLTHRYLFFMFLEHRKIQWRLRVCHKVFLNTILWLHVCQLSIWNHCATEDELSLVVFNFSFGNRSEGFFVIYGWDCLSENGLQDRDRQIFCVNAHF